MKRFLFRTVIIDGVVQSLRQAQVEGQPETQTAGILFRDFMKEVSEDGWEIVAVNRIDEDSFMYTLKKPVTE